LELRADVLGVHAFGQGNGALEGAVAALAAVKAFPLFFLLLLALALNQEHLRRLESAGNDVAAAEQSGQFELRNWADAYLREGHFDQDKMLALVQEVLEGARRQGFALTRLVPHMEWALEDRPGVNDLVEYETRVNYI
jgi:hypothetical protein